MKCFPKYFFVFALFCQFMPRIPEAFLSRNFRLLHFEAGQLYAEGVSAQIKKRAANMSIEEKAAQVLMVNIDGSEKFSEKMFSAFDGIVPGAVLLFKYNLSNSPEKVRLYTDSCKKAFKKIAAAKKINYTPPFFAADNEGGIVFRTASLTSPLPPPEKVPLKMSADEAEKLYFNAGKQMKMMGLNFNLAPVAEVLNGENISVIGGRAFSDNAESAAAYSKSFVRGMNAAGVFCSLKHFPGNGSADPHNGRAEITAEHQVFLEEYVGVFKNILKDKKLKTAVLVSHAAAEFSGGKPFCLSQNGIEFYLRGEADFKGIILTDDIAMKGLKINGKTSADNAADALAAGCTMIMTSEGNVKKLVGTIAARAAHDNKFAEILENAVIKILSVKEEMGLSDKSGNEIPAEPFNIKKFNKIKAEGVKLSSVFAD